MSHADQATCLMATADLLGLMGLPTSTGRVRITGSEQRSIARRRISTASAAALAATGAATAEYWRRIGGDEQTVTVNMHRATQALYVGAHTKRSDGWRPTAGYGAIQTLEPMNPYFRTHDGRWIDLVLGSARPNQVDRVLQVLDCERDSIAKAVASRDGLELEGAIHATGATAGLVRTAEEWRATPQGQHLDRQPVIRVERIGDAPPRRRTAADNESDCAGVLSGLRVLDATHVIAGPMVARTLAEQGADVLHVTRPVNHDTEMFLLDLGVGKRNIVIDLDAEAGRADFGDMAATADVLVQSYRPGALAARGFSPVALAESNPGIVVVQVSCFGETGPDGHRRGVDPVAQAVTGLAVDEADADGRPMMNPMVTLTDPLVGYLGASGVMAALARQVTEGGSWLVRVSLAGSAMWLQDLGWSDATVVHGQSLSLEHLVAPRTVQFESPHFSTVIYLAPVVEYSATPSGWSRPPEPATVGKPEWLSGGADRPEMAPV
ncbi:CoA transferase [Rhodococcus sp. MS16]|nr:CoA transferase [Rhodococcus sp. MS16]